MSKVDHRVRKSASVYHRMSHFNLYNILLSTSTYLILKIRGSHDGEDVDVFQDCVALRNCR
jgi:hypothetical protein